MINSDLQSIIRDTDFFENGIVQFCTEDKLIVTMNNIKGGVRVVKEVRKILQRVIEKYFKKLRIPAVWLLYHQCIQIRGERELLALSAV